MLFSVFKHQSEQMIKFLVNYFLVFQNGEEDNISEIHAAIKHSHSYIFIQELICKLKLDPKAKDQEGKNALMIASECERLDIVKYLIEGIKLNPKEKDLCGRNCLSLAAEQNSSLEVIKYLVEVQKIDPKEKDE